MREIFENPDTGERTIDWEIAGQNDEVHEPPMCDEGNYKHPLGDMNYLKAKPPEDKCDICGIPKAGPFHPVFDENYNEQSGLKQCETCMAQQAGI